MLKVDVSADLTIIGGLALTMDGRHTQIPDAVIEVKGNRIASIRSEPGYKPAFGTRVLDARGTLLMPGLINGHTHAGMGLLRGIAEDLPVKSWIEDVIFPLERRLRSPEFVRMGAQLSCIEMARAGISTFNDMYYFAEEVAAAGDQVGLRSICALDIQSHSGVQSDESSAFETFDRFQETVAKYPRVTPAIAPHSIYGVTREMMEKVIRYAADRNLLAHIHLSEMEEEVRICQAAFGQTPPQYLESLGFWQLKTIAAHVVCVTPEDIEILARRGVGVIHNPESNLKLGTRIAPVVELRRAGISVGLGTDSVASNNNLSVIPEADLAAKLQAHRVGPGRLTARDAVGLLTWEGARAIHRAADLGMLAPGYCADIIALDLERPHAVPFYDPYAFVAYSAQGTDVRHSVVDGQVILEDFRLTLVDEEALLREARSWAKHVRQAAAGILPLKVQASWTRDLDSNASRQREWRAVEKDAETL